MKTQTLKLSISNTETRRGAAIWSPGKRVRYVKEVVTWEGDRFQTARVCEAAAR